MTQSTAQLKQLWLENFIYSIYSEVVLLTVSLCTEDQVSFNTEKIKKSIKVK